MRAKAEGTRAAVQLATYMNQQAKANEVTALSVIVHRAVNQDGPTAAPEKGFQSFSMVHTDTHTPALAPVRLPSTSCGFRCGGWMARRSRLSSPTHSRPSRISKLRQRPHSPRTGALVHRVGCAVCWRASVGGLVWYARGCEYSCVRGMLIEWVRPV